MSWLKFLIVCSMAASAVAAVLPAEFAGAGRVPGAAVVLTDRPVWDEYGLEISERANYGPASVSAYRFKDTTGAFAALQWLTGEASIGGMVAQVDNYILHIEGAKFKAEQIQALASKLPNRRKASLPSLPGYFPRKNLVPGSERSLLGPASLAKFEPRLSAGTLGFDKGAEAQVARYKSPAGEEQLLLINYPTPQIAMERARALQGIAGSVRRSGPLVVAVPAPIDKAAADSLIAQFLYKPGLMWNEPAPIEIRKVGDMILGISLLALILMIGSVVLGLCLGGIRGVMARMGGDSSGQGFTSLHLTQPGS